MYIYFKEKVTSGRETYHPYLEVVSDSDANSSENGAFCGDFRSVESVITIVPNVPYGVPEFLNKGRYTSLTSGMGTNLM